jgi:tRNA threonylcarbamoyladenosine biosynthesis protein TsaE
MSKRPLIEEHVTASEFDTVKLACSFASSLKIGDILFLSGEIGSGKTVFVKGLATGLGISSGDVSSPTFSLINEYKGVGLSLYHVDLYRVDKTGASDLGLEELGVNDGILAIEWPERLAYALPVTVNFKMQILDETTRKITIRKNIID